jgi:putative membrane protein
MASISSRSFWVFWILLIALIVWGAKQLFGREETRSKGKTALAILEARYARGEIEKAEFESRRQDLLG